VASLDQQSFPWKQFSAVDDVLVYSLFSSKRRTNGYRAIKTERVFGEEDTPVTAEKGIVIRNITGEYLPERGVRNTQDFEKAARALVQALPEIFLQQQLSIIEQYVLISPWFADLFNLHPKVCCIGMISSTLPIALWCWRRSHLTGEKYAWDSRLCALFQLAVLSCRHLRPCHKMKFLTK
jgi:hypothetical protein